MGLVLTKITVQMITKRRTKKHCSVFEVLGDSRRLACISSARRAIYQMDTTRRKLRAA